MKKEYFFLFFSIVFLGVSYYFLIETPFLFDQLNYSSETKVNIINQRENSTSTKEETSTSSSEKENTDPISTIKINYSTSSKVVNAVYLTAWSAGREYKIDYVLNLVENTEINAVVINVKDFAGNITYNSDIEEVEDYETETVMIPELEKLLKELNKKEVYTIARVPVFQDKLVANLKPELAVHDIKKIESTSSLSTSTLWEDKIGLSWIDPAAKEYWEYILKISKEVKGKGFDEINFDYIRFPSDGNLKDIYYPHSNKKDKRKIIKEFFEYLHKNLATTTISADLFGLTTVNYSDLGIGQNIEDAYGYFDYVCPMIYPSHFTTGFLNLENPAKHPYKVIKDSMEVAQYRLDKYEFEEGERKTKLRPWLQDFDLNDVPYKEKEVRAQIKAVYDALPKKDFAGFMLWSPNNIYTEEALKP